MASGVFDWAFLGVFEKHHIVVLNRYIDTLVYTLLEINVGIKNRFL